MKDPRLFLANSIFSGAKDVRLMDGTFGPGGLGGTGGPGGTPLGKSSLIFLVLSARRTGGGCG